MESKNTPRLRANVSEHVLGLLNLVTVSIILAAVFVVISMSLSMSVYAGNAPATLIELRPTNDHLGICVDAQNKLQADRVAIDSDFAPFQRYIRNNEPLSNFEMRLYACPSDTPGGCKGSTWKPIGNACVGGTDCHWSFGLNSPRPVAVYVTAVIYRRGTNISVTGPNNVQLRKLQWSYTSRPQGRGLAGPCSGQPPPQPTTLPSLLLTVTGGGGGGQCTVTSVSNGALQQVNVEGTPITLPAEGSAPIQLNIRAEMRNWPQSPGAPQTWHLKITGFSDAFECNTGSTCNWTRNLPWNFPTARQYVQALTVWDPRGGNRDGRDGSWNLSHDTCGINLTFQTPARR